MYTLRRYAFSLFAVVALATIACSASDGLKGADGAPGTPGTAGAAGAAGQDGAPGVVTGTITGSVTYLIGTESSPASGVAVALSPDVGITATTDAAGTYELANVPAGVYSVKFSGNGYTAAQADGVSVVATQSATVSKVLVSTNPLSVVAKAILPAGFGAQYTLGVTVSGGTAPYTYRWTNGTAPTAVTVSDTTASAPTFTAGTVKAILDGGKVVGFGPEARGANASFMGVSVAQLASLTYNFSVTVTDAKGWTKTATVGAPVVTLAQGNTIVPRNQVVLVSVPGASSAPAFTPAAGSGLTAANFDAGAQVAWFFPDVEGVFQVAGLTVHSSNFHSSSPTCGVCHAYAPGVSANVAAKFRDWNNSAHGNHYFKFMSYKSSDPASADYNTLVWTDPTVLAPTADTTIFWTSPGPMTTFEFGLIGAEGSHYSSSCISCHTVGYNALAQNGGMDDVMAANGYTLPNLNTVLGGDATTKTPVMTAWNAMPGAVKNFAGMQCESCHGPINTHAVGLDAAATPVPEYSVNACAVCHDKPSNHDRVNLWRKSKHANLAGAIGEAASDTGSSHASDGHCSRCHAGQTAVAWMKQQQAGNPDKLQGASGAITLAELNALGMKTATVQPITCQVCHDSHSTQLRIEGDTKMLPAGFQVNGAGTGAICIVCHNSRNGAHGDDVRDASGNLQPAITVPGLTPAVAAAIGAPHEANQGDVYAGQNAYWVSGSTVSKHMAVADTCVGCHLRYFPAGLTGSKTNHSFGIDSSICKNCHGTNVNIEAFEARYNDEVASSKAAIMAGCQNVLRGTGSAGFKVNGVAVDPTASVVTVTDFANGRTPAFTVTVGSTTYAAMATTKFTKPDGSALFDPNAGDIAKANWNFTLAQDGSKSIHNPTFVFNILAATQQHMAVIAIP